MAVPLRVLWNLKISRVEKISIGLVFAVGLITMVTAIIRSVTLNSTGGTGQVSTTWLMLVRLQKIVNAQSKLYTNILFCSGLELKEQLVRARILS